MKSFPFNCERLCNRVDLKRTRPSIRAYLARIYVYRRESNNYEFNSRERFARFSVFNSSVAKGSAVGVVGTWGPWHTPLQWQPTPSQPAFPQSLFLSLSLSLSLLSRHEVHEGCLSVRPFRPFRPSLRLHARPYVIPLFCHRASLHRLLSLSLLPFHRIDPVRTHRPLAHSKLLGFGTIWCSN